MKNCFIIINYNDSKSTIHLVNNIIGYEVIDHILIVDNASKKSDKENLLTIKNKKTELLFLDKNIGYSSAINVGAKHIIDTFGEINLIISNTDIVIMSEEDLKRMIELLNNELIGIIGPQILERGIINRGHKNITPKKDFLLGIPFINSFIEDDYLYYRDNYYDNEISSVDVITSCFFLISSDTLKKVNYLDENIFLYYEDFILCKKIKDLGLMVTTYNKVKVKHLYASSIASEISKKEKYKMFKESQYYYHKQYNGATKFDCFLFNVSKYFGLVFKSFRAKRK